MQSYRDSEASCSNQQFSSQTSSPEEKLYQFDLHGCFVFDDFSPITCPPRKGVIATLVPLVSVEQIRAVVKADVPTEITVPTSPIWVSTNMDVPDASSSIFVVPVTVPPEVLIETSLDAKELTAPKSRNPAKLEKLAKDLIEKRKGWIKQMATSSLAGITQHLGNSGKPVNDTLLTLDSDTTGKEYGGAQDEFESEIDHYKEFLESVPEQTEPLRSATKTWLEGLLSLLRQMEVAGCLAVVVVGLLPKGTSSSLSLDLASFLPNSLRSELQMPAIFYQQHYDEFDSFISLYRKSAVNRAVVSPIPLKPGDHVYREMREKGALKYLKHHGIYTGNGRIIHFAGNEFSLSNLVLGKKNARICTTSIIRFMRQGSRLKTRRYANCDEPEVVIHRAEDALFQQEFNEYSLFSNNCEHFASYCKTGKSRSKQVEITKGITMAVAGVTAAAVVAGLAMRKR